MRIIIYGAGAIGGVVGGHLARVGHDVIVIGRPGHVKAIQGHGLRLVTPTDTHILRLPAVTSPDQIDFGPDNIVFFCMKTQDTETALRDLHAVIEDVPIFCLQNGVRNEEYAAQYFPRVYGVMVRVGAVYLTEGEVLARSDPPGWLVMGRYPEGTDKLVECAATKLRDAGFLAMVTPDVMPYKWGKLMINLANAIGAISNGTPEDTKPIAKAVRQETEEILTQAGIHWISAEQLAQEWPEITIPPRGKLESHAKSSTWQSLARQQGTVETEFFNGEIVRLAKQLGLEAPLNETLLRIIQEMSANQEPPGKYTVAQLCALLGLDYSPT